MNTYICNNPGNQTVVVSNFPDNKPPSNAPSILPLPALSLATCEDYSSVKRIVEGISQYVRGGTDMWKALEYVDGEMEYKVARTTTKVGA